MARDISHPRGDDRPPLGQLGPEPWLTAASTRAVMAALQAEGGRARFVGGCIRDTLAHRAGPDVDIDIATTEPPTRVMALLDRAGIRTMATGLAHGTVTAVVEGRPFEITTLRRDLSCDGRHAEVAFTTSFFEDAKRRDVTFNALSADGDGRIYDYFNGIADLSAGRVCFIGRAQDRIQEDFLRILRFFRLYAWYGVPPIDEEAMSACGLLAAGLDTLSAERIHRELRLILAAPDPAGVLALMRGARVLERILPGVGDLAPLRALVMLETRGLVLPGLGPDALRRLACALGAGKVVGPRGGEEASSLGLSEVAQRLRLSRGEARRLLALGLPDPARWPAPERGDAALRRLLDADGAALLLDRALLAWAAERAGEAFPHAERTARWRSLLETLLAWDPPPFPVTGDDLLARGLSGPALGGALATLRARWLDANFSLDRAALLADLPSV